MSEIQERGMRICPQQWEERVVRLVGISHRSIVAGQVEQANAHLVYIIAPLSRTSLAINGRSSQWTVDCAAMCEPGDELIWRSGGGMVWELQYEVATPASEPEQTGRTSIVPLPDSTPRGIAEAIAAKWAAGGLERFHCQSLFLNLLYLLLRQMAQPVQEDTWRALEEVKAYIDAHYQEKLAVAELAQRAGISPGYFMQRFRKRYGSSPISYLLERRLEAAKRWLRRMPPIPLHEVGRLAGFEDENYFSRRFKQKMGVTPSLYRQRTPIKAVALNYHTFGYLLSLQIVPSGAILDPRYVREYYERFAASMELRLDHMPGVEAVVQALAAHEPDVIVVRENVPAEQIAKLQRLASVLVLPWNPLVGWREMFQLTATFLRKEPQAAQWLAQYEQRKAQVRQQLSSQLRGDALLIIGVTDQGMIVAGNRHAGSVLYEDLGFTPAFYSPKPLYELDIELLATIDPQRILLIVDASVQARQSLHALVNHPLWHELSAVRQRKVHQVERGLWFEYTPDAHWWSLNKASLIFANATDCANYG